MKAARTLSLDKNEKITKARRGIIVPMTVKIFFVLKKTLTLIAFALLFSGCRSVYWTEVPISVYPTPPVPLSEFLKNPIDGIYSLPDVAASPSEYFSHNIMLVSGGVVRLSYFQNGRVSTNDWSITEYKSALPSEADFQQVTAKSTDRDIERLLGKPTREGFDYYPIIGIKGRDTKNCGYSWFTLSPSSEFIFMEVWFYYVKSKDGQWVVDELTWDKHGGRRFSPSQTIRYSHQSM